MTRWGEAVTRLLAERGWTRRQLAEAASVRPNTLTNLIKHGKDSDTATLSRIAAALEVDIAELFLSKEHSVVLQAHRESRVDRLKSLVVRELSETITRLVAEELKQSGGASAGESSSKEDRPAYQVRRKTKRTAR